MKKQWVRRLLGASAGCAVAGLLGPGNTARAADINWTNAAGGNFATPGNWAGGVVPGPIDFAHFQVVPVGTGPTYAVAFTANTTTRGMYVHRDNVTWNLAGTTYTQSGSTAFDPFLVGQNAGEVGSLTINDGTVNTSIASGAFNTVIGKAGIGTLTLNNAANWIVITPLLVGQSNSGTFNINPGGSLLLANSLFVGGSTTAAGGTGVVNLAGGSVTVNGGLTIWNSGAAAPGGTRFNLSSGSLTVGSFGVNTTPARFNWTGGALTVTSADLSFNSIGQANFSFGSGPGQTLTTQRDQLVGNTSGQVVSQTGGSNTVGSAVTPRSLYVGYFSTGTYNLSGSSTLTVSGNEVIGSNAIGAFVQSGGTHTVGGTIFVGAFAVGASGTYQVNGGSLAASSMVLGESLFGVSGALSITGGTTNVSGVIDVMPDAGSVTMSGGTLNVGRLGVAAHTALNWTGGTINSTESVSISQNVAVGGDTALLTSGGNVTLSSSKSLATSGSERIGLAAGAGGSGSVTQTGGSNTIAAGLELGYGVGSTGTYALQSGTVSAGNVYVGGNAGGSAGTGTLNISGGTFTTPGTLRVWNAGSAVSLSGGALSVGAFDFGGDSSRFNWTGGNVIVTTGNLTLEAGGVIGDTVPVGGGLSVTGGSLTNNGTINLAGTTISGVGIVNNAVITGHGTIAGTGLVSNANSGHIIQSGGHITYANTGVLVNAGTITLAPGYQFNASTGGGIGNNATINLNGGTLVTAITNATSGTISGPGTMTGALDNFGMIDLPTGTLNLPSFTNAGVIALGSNGANLAGGSTIINNGTLEGVGKVVANVTNNNTIQTGAGTLWFATAPVNTSAGTIVVSPGGKILITAPPSNNAGTIVLAGGTLDVNNQGFTNGSNGNITGYGTIRAAALTNNGGGSGAITFTGDAGALVFGNVTNKGGSTMIVTGNATATFNDAVTNNAGSEFRVSTGATAVFLGPVTGSAAFTGAGLKIFEGGAPSSPAAIATEVGSTFVDVSASVTTGHVRESALTVNGELLLMPGGGTSRAGTLTIAATGALLDLADNKLIVAAGNAGAASDGIYDGLQGDVQRAYNFGSWNGDGLTTSMPGALDGITTIGVATGEQIRGLGPTDTDVWAGETINGASTIAMYTYAGDANLDGQVDAGDYGILDAFIQVEGATGYGNGDFNYDGFIDAADYGTIDNTIQFQGAPFPTSASTAALSNFTAVPEPAACGFAGLTASMLLRRRRRAAPA